MKTLMLFFAGAFIAGMLNAQSNSVYFNNDEVLDSTLTWKFNGVDDSTLAFRKAYHYDNQKRLIAHYEYLNDPAINFWIPYRKLEYAFDGWGNQTLNSLMYYESELGGYMGISRSVKVYNAAGQLMQDIWYGWDYINWLWINPTQTDFEYNDSDSLAWTYTRNQNSETGLWDSTAMVQYNYGAGGKLQQKVEYYPDEETSVLYPQIIYDFEYNASGDRILEIRSFYNHYNGIAYPYLKATSEYNNAHKRIKNEFYGYDESLELWLPMERYDYDWNEAGLLTYYAQYSVDYDTNWFPELKEEITYNDANLKISDIYSSGTNTGEWMEQYKRQYQYNNDHLLVYEIFYQRDTLNNIWNEKSHNEYTYDAQLRMHSNTYFSYINITHQVEQVTREYYYYSINNPWGIGDEPAFAVNLFEVFPNPAITKFEIRQVDSRVLRDKMELALYDLGGRLVIKQTFHPFSAGPIDVDVSCLNPGIYMLTIQCGNIKSNHKIIKN